MLKLPPTISICCFDGSLPLLAFAVHPENMLKSDAHELMLFFDLEWIPDAAAARRLFRLPAETQDAEAMQEFWKRTKGFSDDNPRPFIKYLYSRIVSAAFLSRKAIFRDGEPGIEFSLHSLPKLPLVVGEETSEAYIIERFLYYVGKRSPQLVGYNSQDSDLQVLVQRGMINEVSSPGFCARPAKPWEGRDYFDSKNSEWHLDIFKRFQNYGLSPTLDELAKLCGFPGKADLDGSMVVDLWLRGDLQSIVEYNQIDVLNTYLIWLRFVYFCGKLTDEQYATEQDEFRGFLESRAAGEQAEHISRFLDEWVP